ncbi:unnamed protein product [Orchesella dallaii]|uniref:Uncharacterized protein n=1 Tax=Orchesella dallaii TaxID=48710 RepID=A0ABP1QD90_9HEXA
MNRVLLLLIFTTLFKLYIASYEAERIAVEPTETVLFPEQFGTNKGGVDDPCDDIIDCSANCFHCCDVDDSVTAFCSGSAKLPLCDTFKSLYVTQCSDELNDLCACTTSLVPRNINSQSVAERGIQPAMTSTLPTVLATSAPLLHDTEQSIVIPDPSNIL